MKRLLFAIPLVVFFAVRCSSSSDTSTNAFSIAAPAVAVTSPTTTATSASTYRVDETKPTELKPLGEMITDAKADFGLPPAELVTKFGAFTDIKSYQAPCFGPSWTDNATGGSLARPSGDLGIVYATFDDVKTEACAASQMNALIAGKPHLFNKVRTLVTVLLAEANAEGKSLPEVGGSIDVTMPAITNFTFTKAKLERLADDADGNKVYKTSLEGTVNSKPVSIALFHTPMNADNTEFKGLFQAVLPHSPSGGSGNARGLSVVYSQTAGVLTLALDAAANRMTADTGFFSTTTGRIDYSKSAAEEDLNKMIAKIDTATGAGTVHFAWQAGAGDVASRVFAVTTTGTAEGSTGIGYFGFGNKINDVSTPITDDTSTIWGTRMICNWLGNPSAFVAKIEKQTMTVTSGEFRPTVSNINFAPTDTCDHGGGYAITLAQPSFYNVGSHAAVTNDLVSYGSDIPAITAPTFTLP